MKLSRYLGGTILAVLLALAPLPAAADDVDKVLGFLADAGVVDPALKDAAGLIRCLATSSSPSKCTDTQAIAADLQSEAVSEAEKQAGKFLPDDPMVKAVVDIVRAARAQDWLRVLELTGVRLLGQIACKSGLAVTGPLQPFICGEFASLVLDKAEPVVHELLVIAKDFPNVNVWKLVSLLGFELACEIVKDEGVPLANEACGVLGAAVKAIVDVGEAILGAVGDGLTAINKAISGLFGGGGNSLLSAEQYYASAIRPLMYGRALERLVNQRQDLGLDQADIAACLDYSGPAYGAACTDSFSKRLKKESEALVKLAMTMPGAYVEGHLDDAVRERAVAGYGQAQALYNYIAKLSQKEWDYLMSGDSVASGVSLMAAYTGLDAGGQAFLRDQFQACRFWVNEQLMGKRQRGVPSFDTLQPSSLATWICVEGAGKRFLAALVAEESRLAKVRSGLNGLGCPSAPGKRYEFDCQSHISFSICVNQSYQDYGKNMYCRIDRDTAARSLGETLVGTLGSQRCRYHAYGKGGSGDFDPRVHCTRPWKQQTCDALLTKFRAAFEAPSSRIRMRCGYVPQPDFDAERERALRVVTALNGGPTVNTRAQGRQMLQKEFDPDRCKTLWDPLVINCPHRAALPEIPADLATPPIGPCAKDPGKHGADAVCYQAIFTAQDSMAEIAATTPLLPATPGGCSLEVSYYVPAAPIVRAGDAGLQAGDQVEISCSFRNERKTLEWAQCDDAAKRSMAQLASAQQSNSRYSGIVAIDGNTVGVGSSPADGSDFTRTQLWSFKEGGTHEIRCQTDNALRFAARGSAIYLDNGVSVEVASRASARAYRGFDAATAVAVGVTAVPSAAQPEFSDAALRLVESATVRTRGAATAKPAKPEPPPESARRPGKLKRPPGTDEGR